MARLRPYSRPAALAKIDGRTREAALLRTTRADLTAHVGGKPSATQRALIDRATMLTLHLALIDEKALRDGAVMTEHDSRTYLAWSANLTRTMRALGFKGPTSAPPTLSEYMAAKAPAA